MAENRWAEDHFKPHTDWVSLMASLSIRFRDCGSINMAMESERIDSGNGIYSMTNFGHCNRAAALSHKHTTEVPGGIAMPRGQD